MSVRPVVTVLFSVALSVSASLAYSAWKDGRRISSSSSLETSEITIVDANHRVRCKIGLSQVGGRDVPQIALSDSAGRIRIE